MKNLEIRETVKGFQVVETEIKPLVAEANLQAFVDKLNEAWGHENLQYSYEILKIRARIVMNHYSSTSVYCFIDWEGNILFPAGWARVTPSSPIRGNIFNEDPLKGHKWSSVKYLK